MTEQRVEAKDLVLTATTAAFEQKDVEAVGRYFSPAYVEHAQASADGQEGLRGFISILTDDFAYRRYLALADGGLVVVYGEYLGFGPDPLQAFDIWRVEGSLVVEHWDAIGDGPVDSGWRTSRFAEPTDGDRTNDNRRIVEALVSSAIEGAQTIQNADYLAANYTEYGEPRFDVSGSEFEVAAVGSGLRYLHLHQLIAEGAFVFSRAEGTTDDGARVAINDLWRLEGGKIVAHWGILEPIQEAHQHDNGVF